MRMEAGAPFLEALAPPLVLGQWRHTPSAKSDEVPAPTSAHLPCCPHPAIPTSTPVLHSCGGYPLLTPNPVPLRVREAELGSGQNS